MWTNGWVVVFILCCDWLVCLAFLCLLFEVLWVCAFDGCCLQSTCGWSHGPRCTCLCRPALPLRGSCPTQQQACSWHKGCSQCRGTCCGRWQTTVFLRHLWALGNVNKRQKSSEMMMVVTVRVWTKQNVGCVYDVCGLIMVWRFFCFDLYCMTEL